MKFEFLSKINSPKDIRGYSNDELLELCKEIRSYTINTIKLINKTLYLNNINKEKKFILSGNPLTKIDKIIIKIFMK